VATGLVSMLLANLGFYGIVAEENGRIVGSNFADHRSSIAGIGPISIDPEAQIQGIGRKLMRPEFALPSMPVWVCLRSPSRTRHGPTSRKVLMQSNRKAYRWPNRLR
jgi:Acetyltransferase (GNAT) domain